MSLEVLEGLFPDMKVIDCCVCRVPMVSKGNMEKLRLVHYDGIKCMIAGRERLSCGLVVRAWCEPCIKERDRNEDREYRRRRRKHDTDTSLEGRRSDDNTSEENAALSNAVRAMEDQ